MSNFKIRYLPLADVDLIEIDERLCNAPVKASKFFAALDKQTALLADMPYLYPVYEDVPPYRKMVVLDYLVFYIVDEQNNRVDIHRIISGRMDVSRQLTD
jgi:plasmid stabilization system protein ParE